MTRVGRVISTIVCMPFFIVAHTLGTILGLAVGTFRNAFLRAMRDAP